MAFQWLAFSARPLRLDELVKVLSVQPISPCLDSLIESEDVVAICSSLVTLLPSGELKLAHFTVKEYLTSNRIMQTSVSAFAINESGASTCIVEYSIAYLGLLHHRESFNTIIITYDSLCGSPYTFKEISASQDIRRMFSSKSLAPKPFMRCFRADTTKSDLKIVAMDQEYELLGYAALYWVFHLQKISHSDMTAVLPSILKFFHSGHAFLNWLCAYGIATRGMKSVVSDAKVLLPSRFPIEFSILSSMVNILALATPAHSFDIFDGQANEIDDRLCRIMFDAVLEQSILALTVPLENYNRNELELTLARFMFKDFDMLCLQEYLELYDTKETIIRCWSRLADTRGTYPCQLRLQFVILLKLVLVHKCFKILGHLLIVFPMALVQELHVLFEFAVTVDSKDMLEYMLKRRVVLHGNIKLFLISTIQAKNPKLLGLLLCRSPPPADT